MICANITALGNAKPDICVIGAGPVGISLALELSRRGKSVLLLESGGTAARPDLQQLSDANIVDLKQHVPMDLAVQRRLGGASNLWGGRCVPMDALDFEPRAILDLPAWPITAADLEPFLPLACDYLGCGDAIFESSIHGLNISRPDFRFDRLERWSLRPNLRIAYLSELRQRRNLTLCLLATAVGFEFDRDGLVRIVKLRGPENAYVEAQPRQIVVAAGGLENTRLLLASQQEAPRRFGGQDGPLGRYYMGHLDGSVAQIVIHSPALDEGMDYYNDETGSCVRRRFWPNSELQRRLSLTNVTLRPEFPPIHEPSHGNGVLSLAYLGLSVPPLGRLVVPETIRQRYMGGGGVRRAAHLRNIARDLPHVVTFFPRYVYRRYLTHSRAHSFFERCPGRRYALRYHAEHLPHRDSRVTLSGERDAFGLPRLSVDFRFTSADAEPLIRTHQCFADWLAATGLGALYWSVPPEERVSQILDQSKDGQHQIGTTRMGLTEQTGVVDKDCRVFGVPNLFVAGTSTFCSSGHANPTLTAVALAMRLAHKLSTRDTVRELESEGTNSEPQVSR